MPGSFQTSTVVGIPFVPATRPGGPQSFANTGNQPFQYPYIIKGVTYDSGGNPLAGVTVTLYRTADNSIAGITVSDASGNYLFQASNNLNHYAVGYLASAPDVTGATLNTLVGQ